MIKYGKSVKGKMDQVSQSIRQKRPLVIAAIPAFNEEHYIGSIVLKTNQYVDETFVIDDGSTDQTANVARLAGATVLKHDKNKGYGASIRTIWDKVKEKDPDILILLDGDSQHNPDDILKLMKPISEGYDLVIGSREQQKQNVPTYRRIGQRIIAHFSSILSGEELFDSESGFRAFSRKAISQLILVENGMAISAETIAKAHEKGLKITDIPISIRYTKDGSTLNPIRHGLGVLGRILLMISERKPLFFFGIIGIFLIIFGLLTGLRVIIISLGEGQLAIGTALITILFLVIGSFSIFSGIILHVMTKSRN